MANHETLRDRVAAGMVDDTFRDEKGEPFLLLRPDGVVVPNGAASDEASLTKAREVLMAPPKWPVRIQPQAPFMLGPENTLLPVNDKR